MIDEKTALEKIMKVAWQHGILIPAFNVPYLPMMKPILSTLKKTRTFGLAEVARPEVEKFGAKSFKKVAEEYFSLANRKFSRLHLDHIPVIDEDGKQVNWEDLIKECLDLNYDSVMIDGSRLTLEENIRATRRVVELAHEKGVPVEAELGAVLGHEAGPLPPYEELFRTGRGFTEPEQAERFVKETGVNWLSVAIGSIHGAISETARDKKKVTARLDINHLKKLRKVTQVPLVLHGGSGIEKFYVLEAIKNGITKINIGTVVRQVYEESLREAPNDVEAAQRKVSEKIEQLIKEEYEIQGSWDILGKWL